MLCLATPAPAKNKKINLRIIETSDVHGCFFPYNFIERKPMKGTLARVSTYVNRLRKHYGDNLILLDRYSIQQKLFVGLPYIKEARINPNLPSTLSVEVMETKAVAALPGAGAYWLISRDGKLLEAVDETGAQDYLRITGLEAVNPAVSARLELPEP